MWLFPPPCTRCCSIYTVRRKSSQNILGRRPALLPTGRAKGNPLRSVPQSLGPSNVSAGKDSKKGPWCSLNICRVTLRWHFTPLCSSSQPPVKVGRCYKGRLWRVCRHISVAFRHLFTGFLRIKKINKLCCDRISIHILTTVPLHSLNEPTNLTAPNNFTDETGLINTLNGFPW